MAALKDVLDLAHPSNLPDACRTLSLGSFLKALVAPAQIVETVTVTSHVGTLAHPAMYAQAVQATAGTYTGPVVIGTKDTTPVAAGVGIPPVCSYDQVAGTVTFAAADGVTACKVQYLTAYTYNDALDAEVEFV